MAERTDTERVDWLGKIVCAYTASNGKFYVSCKEVFEGDTPRQAIDAAMDREDEDNAN